MNSDLLIVLIILLVNLIVAAIYFIFHLKKQQRTKGVLLLIFMLVFPIVGFVFITLAEILNYLLHRRGAKDIDLDDLSFRGKMRIIPDVDVTRSLDQVPIEEALIISGKGAKRKSFINLLKTDSYEDTLPAIRKAVENADLEVAHYAASFVTDVIAKYKDREKKLREKMEDTQNIKDFTEYIRFMSEILDPEIFSITEIKIYTDHLDQAAIHTYRYDPDLITFKCLKVLTDMWHYVGNEKKVAEWIRISRTKCRESLECFKICSSYYFRTGDRDNLIALINDIKKTSSLQIDNETLELIRFVRKG